MQTKSIDTPLSEITLRRYEKPYNLSKREITRKLCLSLGLLNPGDSRDVIVDVLYALLEANTENLKLSSEEIRDKVIEIRRENELTDLGTASSNIRRQIRRLREVLLIEKIKNDYRVTEFLSLNEIFDEKIEKFLIPSILERIKDYLSATDITFPKKDAKL